MQKKAKLRRLIQFTWDEIHSFIHDVIKPGLTTSGTDTDWSMKDHYAHIAAWMIQMVTRYTEPEKEIPERDDIDMENARIFSEWKDKSWDEVIKDLDTIYQKTIDFLDGLSEEQLLTPLNDTRPNAQPAWRYILGNACQHPVSHFSFAYPKYNESERALKIQERIVEDLLALDEDPTWRGTIHYNLACAFALAGDSGKAISLIKRAFADRPNLIEWSTKDTDLDRIRNLPEFIALYSK
jgi:hypothetical protein